MYTSLRQNIAHDLLNKMFYIYIYIYTSLYIQLCTMKEDSSVHLISSSKQNNEKQTNKTIETEQKSKQGTWYYPDNCLVLLKIIIF